MMSAVSAARFTDATRTSMRPFSSAKRDSTQPMKCVPGNVILWQSYECVCVSKGKSHFGM